MAEIEPNQQPHEGELLDDNCSVGSRVCTNRAVELAPDPFAAEVNNEHELIMACPECLSYRALEA
jgi:hypothetical protein